MERAALADRLRRLEESPLQDEARLLEFGAVEAVLCVWLFGSLFWFSRTTARLLLFRRLLRHTSTSAPELRERLELLARRLGIRCPDLLLVPGQLSPMVWSFFGRPCLLFPVHLLDHMNSAQIDTLLVHELVHLSRRDHWVRWLEVVVSGLYWWLPVVWLARRGLHAAEEECCDARVLQVLPDARRDYAQALVQVLAFLSSTHATLPAMASGVGAVPQIKRRLTMILRARSHSAWTGCMSAAVLLCGAFLLPWAPALAQPAADKQPSPREARQRQIELLRQLLKSFEEQQAMEEKAAAKASSQALYAQSMEAAKQAWQRAVAVQSAQAQAQANQANAAEAQRLEAAVAAARAVLEHAKAQADAAEAQLRQARDQLRRLEVDVLSRGIADPKLEGKITKISSTDKTTVSISLGSAAGLKEGESLEVYRLQPQPEYLGKLRIVIVEANAAVGRLQGPTHGEARLGDRVSRALNSPFPSQPRKAKAADSGSAAVSPDGRVLASVQGNMVTLTDTASGRILSISAGHPAASVAFSPDGRRLATGGGDRNVLLWDAATGKQINTLLMSADVTAVRFTPDSKGLIISFADRTERTFDVTTGQEIKAAGN
jgi:beta-lactamase regulating signal transducer with metallopeptidase domain